jgi:methylenetetrahydrofolate reductase (NADPH)
MSDWASIYEEKSASFKLLKEIYETYYLVNIVDNNYVDSNLLKKLLNHEKA